MASTVVAMASNLIAMAHGLQPSSDGFQPNSYICCFINVCSQVKHYHYIDVIGGQVSFSPVLAHVTGVRGQIVACLFKCQQPLNKVEESFAGIPYDSHMRSERGGVHSEVGATFVNPCVCVFAMLRFLNAGVGVLETCLAESVQPKSTHAGNTTSD